MNKKVLSKKRKTLRANVTAFTSEIDKKVEDDAHRAQMMTLPNQMKSVSQTLNQMNKQIEWLIEQDDAETALDRVLQYEMNIVARTTKLEENLIECIAGGVCALFENKSRAQK